MEERGMRRGPEKEGGTSVVKLQYGVIDLSGGDILGMYRHNTDTVIYSGAEREQGGTEGGGGKERDEEGPREGGREPSGQVAVRCDWLLYCHDKFGLHRDNTSTVIYSGAV